MGFVRENKYSVLKWEDISELSPKLQETFNEIEGTIHINRRAKGKPACNSYVVVNEEEPYVEIVWQLIKLWASQPYVVGGVTLKSREVKGEKG